MEEVHHARSEHHDRQVLRTAVAIPSPSTAPQRSGAQNCTGGTMHVGYSVIFGARNQELFAREVMPQIRTLAPDPFFGASAALR
jgi:hypothetical protein